MTRELINGVVNRIAKVGVELEGGWDRDPGIAIEHDGSVRFEDPPPMVIRDDEGRERRVQQRGPRVTGEAVSEPMKVLEVPTFITRYFPQHVNATCGLHVHMSFHNHLNYARLMLPDFTPTMVEALVAWGQKVGLKKDHVFWQRLLAKDHPHCAHQYLGDRQVHITRKDYHSRGKDYSRYTALNYCRAQHSTIECRLLPMLPTADLSIEAVQCVLDTTNRFLARMRTRESKVPIHVMERAEVFQEFGTIVQ